MDFNERFSNIQYQYFKIYSLFRIYLILNCKYLLPVFIAWLYRIILSLKLDYLIILVHPSNKELLYMMICIMYINHTYNLKRKSDPQVNI